MTTLSLDRACEQLAEMIRHRKDGLVEFARYHAGSPNPTREKFAELETKLLDNGIILFARQEFDRRIYHVVEKRLADVLEGR